MAFTPEDGTGVADANSYCDVAFADGYFTDRAIAAWTGEADVNKKQAALIAATDYIEGRYNRRFIGVMKTTTQGLSWPRSNAYVDGNLLDDASVPEKLKRATAEYAVRALFNPLAPDPTIDASGVSVVNTVKQVGPLRQDFEALGSKVPHIFRPYPAADMLLASLVTPGGRVYR